MNLSLTALISFTWDTIWPSQSLLDEIPTTILIIHSTSDSDVQPGFIYSRNNDRQG
jgi:hypothetical protein